MLLYKQLLLMNFGTTLVHFNTIIIPHTHIFRVTGHLFFEYICMSFIRTVLPAQLIERFDHPNSIWRGKKNTHTHTNCEISHYSFFFNQFLPPS